MKITLLSDDAIRYEPTPGPLTIEAATAEMGYSPFHMLASALASCTFSVLHSWATHKKLSADDLSLEVHWRFGDDPHRVSDFDVRFDWPALPADRMERARRVAALCTVHATLMHPPRIDIQATGAVAGGNRQVSDTLSANMHGDPAAAPAAATTPSDSA